MHRALKMPRRQWYGYYRYRQTRAGLQQIPEYRLSPASHSLQYITVSGHGPLLQINWHPVNSDPHPAHSDLYRTIEERT